MTLCFLFAEHVKHGRFGSRGLRRCGGRWLCAGVFRTGFRGGHFLAVDQISPIEEETHQPSHIAGPPAPVQKLTVEVGAHRLPLSMTSLMRSENCIIAVL